MSTHPNVILLCALKPDGLARKTYRQLVAEMGVKEDEDFPIGSQKYHAKVMETDYDDDWQIGADEGDILVFDLVTYGYGEKIKWDELSTRKDELEQWAKQMCEKFTCSYSIWVTANYW